jgi:hypothetical protein
MTRHPLHSRQARAFLGSVLFLGAVNACQCATVVDASGHVKVNPASIAFGNVPIGTTDQVTVDVTNTGRGPLLITGIKLKNTDDPTVTLSQLLTANCDGSPRAQTPENTSPEGAKLLSTNCASFVVSYAPNAQVALNNAIVITSTDDLHPTVTIPLTGAGVGGTIEVCLLDPTTGAVEPSSCYPGAAMPPTVNFGTWPVGMSAVRKVRVLNEGKYNLAVNNAHIAPSMSEFSLVGTSVSPVIMPGDFFDFEVQFTPSGNGNQTASLILPSNDVVNPSVTVPLVAVSEGPALCITPNPIAFGSVNVATSKTIAVTLTNCGNTAFNVNTITVQNGNASSTVFTTPASGSTGAIPSLPTPLAMGATATFNIIYTPTMMSTDTGTLTVVTNYQTQSVPITGAGGAPACTAGATPTADILVENAGVVVDPTSVTFPPLTNLTLNGRMSSVPSPSTITTYAWSVVSQPAGSVAAPMSATSATPTFFMELLGDYVVQLIVGTNDGCKSAPVTVTLHVVTTAAIHVQLTWPQAYGDMDLHYQGPGGTLGEESPVYGDVYYIWSEASACGTALPQSKYPSGCSGGCETGLICNAASTGCVVDWGQNNQCDPDNTNVDDASLDVDQLFGYGPENVTQNKPFDGTYKVTAIYYAYDSCTGNTGSGTTTAEISIFVNGTLAWHGAQPNMEPCDAWDAADIVVANSGTSITVNPLSGGIRNVSGNANGVCAG